MKKIFCFLLLLMPITSFACPDFVAGNYQCKLLSGNKQAFDTVVPSDVFAVKQSSKQGVNSFEFGSELITEGDESEFTIDDTTTGTIKFQCERNSLSRVGSHPDGTVRSVLRFFTVANVPVIGLRLSDTVFKGELNKSFEAQCDLVAGNEGFNEIALTDTKQRQLKNSITNYYHLNSPLVGKYKINSIDQIKVIADAGDLRVYIQYQFEPLQKDLVEAGQDQRIFYLKEKADGLTVLAMGEYNSAKVAFDDISDYFTAPWRYETADTKDRSRYLDYLISRHIVNTLGINERLETNLFWDLEKSTKSYRSSQIARNVEKIFAEAGTLRDDCQSELKKFKQSSSYSSDEGKPEFNNFMDALLGNWVMTENSLENYDVNMELYMIEMNSKIPLANCKVWTDLHKKNLLGIKAGSKVSKYDGIIPSCGAFQQLKQCSLDFYQAIQKRILDQPKNRVIEYVDTGIWLNPW